MIHLRDFINLLFEDLGLTTIFLYKKWLKWIKIIFLIYLESLFIKPNNFYINIYNINLPKKFMK